MHLRSKGRLSELYTPRTKFCTRYRLRTWETRNFSSRA